jgi:hypothetical protein
VPEKASFFSRFFFKILEIVGAAVATAVSGYLVAHLGGFLPSQGQATAPAEVVALPSERPAAKSPPSSPSQTATIPPSTQTATTPLPEPRPSLPAETTGSSSQTVVRKTAKAPPPVRKSGKPETAATEPNRPHETADAKPREATESKPPRDSIEAKLREAAEAKSREAEAKSREAEGKSREAEGKSREAEGKSREAAEAKPRDPADTKPREAADDKAVEAQVRAALANVDASHPAPADVPPRRGESQNGSAAARPGEATIGTPARPLEPAAPGNPGQPRSADLGSTGQQPAPSQSPTVPPVTSTTLAPPQQPEALTSVEIKSRPVATIDTQRPPEPAPAPEERGVLSTLKHIIIPDFSRPASSDEAPRPPASVGD